MGKPSKLRGPGKLVDTGYDGQFVPAQTHRDDRNSRRSAARTGSSIKRPEAGRRERIVPRNDRATRADLDPGVKLATDRFMARARGEGLVLAAGPNAVYRDLLERTEVSGLRHLVNPYNGKSMWPDVLVSLVDVYFDTAYKHGDTWCWKNFVSEKNFVPLLEWLLGKIEVAYVMQSDTRTTDDRRAEREEYWAGLAEIGKQWATAPPPPEERVVVRGTEEERVEGMARTTAELFGDDEEEFLELIKKRADARRKKSARRRTREGS